MPVSVVWFKRDFRVSDNRALNEACKNSHPIICLFNLEPKRLERDDVSEIHIQWELDCVRELGKSIEALGGKLLFNFGNIIEKLTEINNEYEISSIFSHEETGLNWSWEYDKLVTKWCKINGVSFTEFPTNGIIRGLHSRDNWKDKRDSRVYGELINRPTNIISPIGLKSDIIPDGEDIGVPSRKLVDRPTPGEKAAILVLFSFLDKRGQKYRSGISSPISAQKACSRLSPYISVGCISIRQILYYTRMKRRKVKINPSSSENRGWVSSLRSFESRLAWHCHFIQRLEFESTMDEVAINPELDKSLQRIYDKDKYQVWAKGETGWPFFDACMRSLTATGWINFRMRAMIQSVASYTLWLPWRKTGMHLARLFLDYEPGIHWSQVHMQSGVTGINSIRAYSIKKQSEEQDPEGDFIRKWVEELSLVPKEFIHEPWLMNKDQQKLYGCLIGMDYPSPIVNEKLARKDGVVKSYSAKNKTEVKRRSKIVYEIHGSRKRRN